MTMRQIKKVGGSYLVILPKQLIEFYDWVDKVVNIEINSEKIILTKTDIKIEPIKEVEVKTKKGWMKL